jgi:hypothetical protein
LVAADTSVGAATDRRPQTRVAVANLVDDVGGVDGAVSFAVVGDRARVVKRDFFMRVWLAVAAAGSTTKRKKSAFV